MLPARFLLPWALVASPHMRFAVLVCATFSFSPAIAANTSYTPGNTCSQGDDSQSALMGKHLRVMELAWAPFATKDATAPKGWTGFNIELMNEISDLLGFTYDIVDIGYPGDGETWGEHAFNYIDKGDVLMSFWVGAAHSNPSDRQPPFQHCAGPENLARCRLSRAARRSKTRNASRILSSSMGTSTTRPSWSAGVTAFPRRTLGHGPPSPPS